MVSPTLRPEDQRRVKQFDPLVLDRTVIAVPLLKKMQEDLLLIETARKLHTRLRPEKYNAAVEFNPNFPGGVAAAHKEVAEMATSAAEKAGKAAEKRLKETPGPVRKITDTRHAALVAAINTQVIGKLQPKSAHSFAVLHASIIRRLLAENERSGSPDKPGEPPIVAIHPRRFEIIIDLNLEHPGGRHAANQWGQVCFYHILICIQIMARPLRLEFARALYHRISRGDRREDIYHDDAVCLNRGYDNERPDPTFCVAKLIDELASQVQRIDLVGHSFGGRVVTASAANSTTDKIKSLALLQTAFSHNGFSKSMNGLFRTVVEQKRVDGPILVTHTKNDKAVGLAYPLASRINGDKTAAFGDENDVFGGIGRNGAQQMQSGETIAGKLLAADGTYQFQTGRFFNLEASDFIKDHSDVTGKEIAHAVRKAVAA